MLINIVEFMKEQELPNYITKDLIQWNNVNDYFKDKNK